MSTMLSRMSFQQRCMRPCSRRAVVACHAEQRKQRVVFLGTPEVRECIAQAQQRDSGSSAYTHAETE